MERGTPSTLVGNEDEIDICIVLSKTSETSIAFQGYQFAFSETINYLILKGRLYNVTL